MRAKSNNCEIVIIAQMFIFMWRFVYRSRRGCLNSQRRGDGNNTTTKQWYHWLKIINNRAARAALILTNIFEVLFKATSQNQQIWGFGDNMSMQLRILNSLFSPWNLSYRLISGIHWECMTWPWWNNRERLMIEQSFILRWVFADRWPSQILRSNSFNSTFVLPTNEIEIEFETDRRSEDGLNIAASGCHFVIVLQDLMQLHSPTIT